MEKDYKLNSRAVTGISASFMVWSSVPIHGISWVTGLCASCRDHVGYALEFKKWRVVLLHKRVTNHTHFDQPHPTDAWYVHAHCVLIRITLAIAAGLAAGAAAFTSWTWMKNIRQGDV